MCLDAYLPSPCVCVIKAELVVNIAVSELMQAAWWTPLNVQVTQMTWINDLYVFWRIHWREERCVISVSLIANISSMNIYEYESDWGLTRH